MMIAVPIVDMWHFFVYRKTYLCIYVYAAYATLSYIEDLHEEFLGPYQKARFWYLQVYVKAM